VRFAAFVADFGNSLALDSARGVEMRRRKQAVKAVTAWVSYHVVPRATVAGWVWRPRSVAAHVCSERERQPRPQKEVTRTGMQVLGLTGSFLEWPPRPGARMRWTDI